MKIISFIGKVICILLIVVLTYILFNTVLEQSKNQEKQESSCEMVEDHDFSLGLRPDVKGNITFGLGQDFNLINLIKF